MFLRNLKKKIENLSNFYGKYKHGWLEKFLEILVKWRDICRNEKSIKFRGNKRQFSCVFVQIHIILQKITYKFWNFATFPVPPPSLHLFLRRCGVLIALYSSDPKLLEGKRSEKSCYKRCDVYSVRNRTQNWTRTELIEAPSSVINVDVELSKVHKKIFQYYSVILIGYYRTGSWWYRGR